LNQQEDLVHVFRHEYGKLVALLSRRFGVRYIDAIEDAVQWSLTQALERWVREGRPSNPAAWLYRVACRHILSELRTNHRRAQLLEQQALLDKDPKTDDEDIPFTQEINDAMLRMLFVACHDSIPLESQLVFTLKSLCGFNIKEIALRLFISEANVYKRFGRAKHYLQRYTITLEQLTNNEITARLPSVHHVLYLVFTEGYLSSHADDAIRQDLCREAIRLTLMLSNSHYGNGTETTALLALMHLHFARISARQDTCGALLLLKQQDRSLWDYQSISKGIALLAESASGDNISRYHIEAGIAAEHCLAESFEKTRWDKIAMSYDLLEQVATSPLHRLNKAIATAEWKNPKAGLAVLDSMDSPSWLERSYYWYAVKADLLFRCDEPKSASEYAELAITHAPTKRIKALLHKRLLSK
jgi:RNA polymerase sigma-70 factor (ECF subfamily)